MFDDVYCKSYLSFLQEQDVSAQYTPHHQVSVSQSHWCVLSVVCYVIHSTGGEVHSYCYSACLCSGLVWVPEEQKEDLQRCYKLLHVTAQ